MAGTNFFEEMYEIIGENIRKHRKIKNYSLQMLAEKVGVTKKTIQRYETCQHKIDGERLEQIAVALDTTVEKLTNGMLKLESPIQEVVNDISDYYSITMDGIYDESGNYLSVEDFIKMQVKNGIKVERKFETKEIYILDQTGNMKIEFRKCEVISFGR